MCRWQLSALFLARPQAEKAGQDNDLSEAKSTWRSSQQLVVAAPFSKFLAARDLTSSAREKRLRLRLCRLRSCPLRSRRAPLLRNPEKFPDELGALAMLADTIHTLNGVHFPRDDDRCT